MRILSIDGGGIRGLIAVRMLKVIEEIAQKPVTELFDLIAGTSTGGLIAAGLTVRDDNNNQMYSVQDIEDIYWNRAKEIFPPKNLAQKLYSFFKPGYSDGGVDKVLSELFKEKKLSDCSPHILITSYDLSYDETLFFKSRHGHKNMHSVTNARLHDVCRATSAAPTYFKPYKFIYQDNGTGMEPKEVCCIDGGVYVNNPAESAIAELLKHGQYYLNRELSLNDIKCLSLGTGGTQQPLAKHNVGGWGALQWIRPLINVMMKGVNSATDYRVHQLLQDNNYLRLNLELPFDISAMDSSSQAVMNDWIVEFDQQILGDQNTMEKLRAFIDTL